MGEWECPGYETAAPGWGHVAVPTVRYGLTCPYRPPKCLHTEIRDVASRVCLKEVLGKEQNISSQFHLGQGHRSGLPSQRRAALKDRVTWKKGAPRPSGSGSLCSPAAWVGFQKCSDSTGLGCDSPKVWSTRGEERGLRTVAHPGDVVAVCTALGVRRPSALCTHPHQSTRLPRPTTPARALQAAGTATFRHLLWAQRGCGHGGTTHPAIRAISLSHVWTCPLEKRGECVFHIWNSMNTLRMKVIITFLDPAPSCGSKRPPPVRSTALLRALHLLFLLNPPSAAGSAPTAL
ncbi:uncharacterized protein LOC118660144 [Myotis myotis]|uniref:uncharacterized protein LOC118660144 n=1 Tax=Myotis myotis TaxID=51298 RepID=UPI00174CA43A|nr:uncharacterized protein LOC118660144 [Myotis myotis]